MKRLLIYSTIFILFSTACNNAKKTATVSDATQLEGIWQLNYISGPRIAFEGLYPNKRPQIIFDKDLLKVTGNTSCNSLSGPVKIAANTISFGDFITTKMACQGDGEAVFLKTIHQVNKFALTEGNTLTLMMDDVAMMRFVRQ